MGQDVLEFCPKVKKTKTLCGVDRIMPCYKHKEEDIIVVKRKRILYGLTMLIVVMTIGVALAIVPPPPANQDLGIYDTVCGEFAEEDCRACHSSGVPDTHHLLVPNAGYGCIDCHQVINDPDGSTGVGVIRDCVVCHAASPHHEAQAAVDRHCSHCHGSFVDDYDDGHSIPTYEPSLITPDTSYTVEDAATGKKWGGCEACHEPDKTLVPPIYSNPETHHTLGSLSLECDMCHGNTNNGENLLSIRKCEDCHGTTSLHNIQYDYANTKGQLGYGHVGDNWDCAGCHAWYVVAYSDAPQTGPIVPSIDQVNPASLWAGVENVVTITGDNFEGTVNDIYYTSEVVIVDGAETITVEPDFITATEIVATIPSLDSGSYGLRVVKSGMDSNLVPIVVVPQATIDSATIRRSIVTLRGSGFGDELEEQYELFGVAVTCEGNALEASIVSWSDSRVVVECPAAAVGDIATVTTLHDSDSATIAG